MPAKLSFIGLGVMGGHMAHHLNESFGPIAIYNRTRAKCRKLVEHGAQVAASPADAVAEADVIFLCLSDTPDVEEVLFGKKGVIEKVKDGAIIIDHSTIAPSATRQFMSRLAEHGVTLLDAPVSGGDAGARDGALSMMIGGDAAALLEVEPYLRVMARTITHCGPSGAGQLTKLVNQILVSVTNLAVCEALTFARKHELNLEKTIQALAGGAAGSWQLANLGPRMVSGDFRPGFAIDLQQKDLRLVLQAADESNTSLPAASLVHQLFSAAQAAGHGRDGTQALFCVIEKLASLQ
jgi:3-hydroxyisobutyrate dehydrogenase